MKTAELYALIETIPTEERNALLSIIDLKIESQLGEAIEKRNVKANSGSKKIASIDGSIKMLMFLFMLIGILMGILLTEIFKR